MVWVLRALSLFSGIGGLDLAAHAAGIKTEAFCEIETFPTAVLNKRFPGIPVFPDITKLKGGALRGSVDVVHGGFPCQDLSVAGVQKGLEDEEGKPTARSGLWFEMLRVIDEIRPRYVVAENVRGAVNLALDTVYSGLVGEGYKVYPYVISASAVGAPHQRERLFVVGVREDVANTLSGRLSEAWSREQAAGITGEDTRCPVADSVNERLQRGERPEALRGEGSSAPKPASQCGQDVRKLWPTPNCRDTRRGCRQFQLTHAVDLQNEADKGGTLWPTPQAVDGSCGGIISPDDTYVQKESGLFRKINRNGTDGSVGLARIVKLWPTPRANKIGGSTSEGYGLCLQEAVNGGRDTKLWPTPTGTERSGINPNTGRGAGLSKVNGGQLNPDWVEQLMNFPEGWTDLEVDEPSKWVGWPALLGQEQYPYEFPRTTTGCKDRAKRLKALGNAVVPAQAYPFFRAIVEIEKKKEEAG